MRKIFLVQIFVIALALSLGSFAKADDPGLVGNGTGDTCVGSISQCGTTFTQPDPNADQNNTTPPVTPTTTPTTTPAVTSTPASNDTTPNTNPSPSPANNGTPCDINNTSPTQICNPIPSVSDVPSLIVKIINYLLGIIAGLSVLMVVIAGFRMVISAGNESAVKSARQQITWAVIGLVVSVLAYSIIAIVKNAIAK